MTLQIAVEGLYFCNNILGGQGMGKVEEDFLEPMELCRKKENKEKKI